MDENTLIKVIKYQGTHNYFGALYKYMREGGGWKTPPPGPDRVKETKVKVW